jgi:Carboxypeptidase regulatory-like domain
MRKWLLAALAAGAMHGAVIRGVVVENLTGKPLLRAMVTLKPLPGTTAPPQTVRTNTSGVFEFVPVPGGSYLVSAARPNFYTIQYGQKDWKATGAPVEVQEEASAFLQIRLLKLGVISGRVVDENDVGLPNHDVVVYRNTRPPQLVTKVTADERGVYRFFNLDPGSYLVKTVARVYEEGSYVPTFSKDTLKVEEARPVDVLLDQEADHIDVRPMQGRLYNIGGAVHPSAMQREGPAAGTPVVVKLTFASDMGRESAETNEGFHFNPVPIGNYELYAEGPGDGSSRCQSVGGYLPFDIKERDKDPTDISMSVPCVQDTPIQIVDSRGTQIDISKVKVKIMARRKDMAGNGEVQQLEILGNRSSGTVRLAPGRWELMAVPPAGYVVTEFGYRFTRSEGVHRARADGWNEVMINGRGNSLRFVLSSNPGSMHGMVSGLSREPLNWAPVFLEGYDPDNHKRVTELRVALTDSHGQYKFSNLPPGSYRVLSTFEFHMPDEATMDLAGAKLLMVEEGKDAIQDLDISVIR